MVLVTPSRFSRLFVDNRLWVSLVFVMSQADVRVDVSI